MTAKSSKADRKRAARLVLKAKKSGLTDAQLARALSQGVGHKITAPVAAGIVKVAEKTLADVRRPRQSRPR